MSSTGQELVSEIQADLACPSCQYNLRGLQGEKIQCPECGQRYDSAQLIARRWTGPWYKAPGFNTALSPLIWFSMGGCALLVPGAFALASIDHFSSSNSLKYKSILALSLFTIYAAVWLALLIRIYIKWPGLEGVLLALLAHPIFIGYALGSIAIVFLTVVVALLVYNKEFYSLVVYAFGLTALLLLLWLLRRSERFIATRCLRRYLRQAIDVPNSLLMPPGSSPCPITTPPTAKNSPPASSSSSAPPAT